MLTLNSTPTTLPSITDIQAVSNKQPPFKSLKHLHERIILIDLGTGEASVTEYFRDPASGIVYQGKKDKFPRQGAPAVFFASIQDKIGELTGAGEPKDRVIIYATSWARQTTGLAETDQTLITLLEGVHSTNDTFFRILNQCDEAKYADISLKHVAKYFNPSLGVDPAKCVQIEGGGGSIQGGCLSEQKVEESGRRGEQLLKQGLSLQAVALYFQEKLGLDFDRAENIPAVRAVSGFKDIFMQGIFPSCLSGEGRGKVPEGVAQVPSILETLAITNKENWTKGQEFRQINNVINAIEDRMTALTKNFEDSAKKLLTDKNIPRLLNEKNETKNNGITLPSTRLKQFINEDPELNSVDAKLKGLFAPTVAALTMINQSVSLPLTLAVLKAIQKKFGHHNYRIFNVKEAFPLYYQGEKTKFEVKITGAHGLAVALFDNPGLFQEQQKVSIHFGSSSLECKEQREDLVSEHDERPNLKLQGERPKSKGEGSLGNPKGEEESLENPQRKVIKVNWKLEKGRWIRTEIRE